MKLRVERENGEIEVIELEGPSYVVPGVKLDRLVNGPTEHFFTSDGHYDGYGRHATGSQ